ncbi:MAG: adenine deaminase C-terminal domain-containing protein [Candidatus Ornithomonoglobus sp.]
MTKTLIKTVMEKEPADFVIKNGYVADIFSGRFLQRDVLVRSGMICGVGDYDCANIIDASGKYILPGFIDSHVHIEASIVTPRRYAEAVVPRGVTTVISVPGAITMVCGKNGIRYMEKAAESLPLDIKIILPIDCRELSCEDAQELGRECIGISERKEPRSIINSDEASLKRIQTKNIDGHMPGLFGKKLDAYICSGVTTDHECRDVHEMLEKISRGLYVAIREGSLSKDLKRLIFAVNNLNFRSFTFCTDDRFIGDILNEGTLDYMVKTAVGLGLPPVVAIAVASFCAAKCYGLDKVGAIAPGYKADLMIVSNLFDFNVEQVFKNGVKVAEDGRALFTTEPADASGLTDTISIGSVTPDFFKHGIYNEFEAFEFRPHPSALKRISASKEDNAAKVCIVDRSGENRSFLYLTNYGITNGAVASNYYRDSHKIIVVGDNDEDMAAALNALVGKGGICVASGGKVAAKLNFDVAGLMADIPSDEVLREYNKLKEAAYSLGVNKELEPFKVLNTLFRT